MALGYSTLPKSDAMMLAAPNCGFGDIKLADEIKAVGTGKTLKVGDVDWVIVEDGVAATIPSLFVEARHFNGVVYLSLAETVIDAGNRPEAHVCARLRMDLGFAQLMRDQLDELIKMALEPTDKSKAN